MAPAKGQKGRPRGGARGETSQGGERPGACVQNSLFFVVMPKKGPASMCVHTENGRAHPHLQKVPLSNSAGGKHQNPCPALSGPRGGITALDPNPQKATSAPTRPPGQRWTPTARSTRESFIFALVFPFTFHEFFFLFFMPTSHATHAGAGKREKTRTPRQDKGGVHGSVLGGPQKGPWA